MELNQVLLEDVEAKRGDAAADRKARGSTQEIYTVRETHIIILCFQTRFIWSKTLSIETFDRVFERRAGKSLQISQSEHAWRSPLFRTLAFCVAAPCLDKGDILEVCH